MNCGKKVVMEDAMSKESFIYFTQQLVFTQFLGHQLLYLAENFELCVNVKRTWTRSGGCDCGQGS